MPLVFDFEALGEQKITRHFDDVGDRATDARPVFEEIADAYAEGQEEQFQTAGSSAGHPWKPLDESTVKRKGAQGLDPGILQATLALKRSLTRPGDPNQIREISPDEMRFGTRLWYAKFPRRDRPITFVEPDKKDVMRRIQRFVVTGSL